MLLLAIFTLSKAYSLLQKKIKKEKLKRKKEKENKKLHRKQAITLEN